MVLYTVANIAQFERRRVSERVIANIEARAKRGLYNGGVVPLGYRLDPEKKGYLFVDPDQADIVQKAFQMFLRERSLSQTAGWLNTEGLRYKREMEGGGRCPRLGHFTITNLKNILTNNTYIGICIFKSKGEIKETAAAWDPIIDARVFGQVQEVLAKNPKRFIPNDPRRDPFLFSGFLYCTQCGEKLLLRTCLDSETPSLPRQNNNLVRPETDLGTLPQKRRVAVGGRGADQSGDFRRAAQTDWTGRCQICE